RSRLKNRSSRITKRSNYAKKLSDAPLMARAEARKEKANLIRLEAEARTKEQDALSLFKQENAAVNAARIKVRAQFEADLEIIKAKEKEKEQIIAKLSADIIETSKQTNFSYNNKQLQLKTEIDLLVNDIEKLKMEMKEVNTVNSAEIENLKEIKKVYEDFTQAEIDQFKKDIESYKTETIAQIKHSKIKAVNIEKTITAKVTTLKKETEAFEKESMAEANKLRVEAGSLKEYYNSETKRLSQEAVSLKVQARNDFDNTISKISKKAAQYAAEVAKLKEDAVITQKVLGADMTVKEAGIADYKTSILVEAAQGKAALTDHLGKKQAEIDMKLAEIDNLERQNNAEAVFQELKRQAVDIRLNAKKEKDVVGVVAKALSSGKAAEEQSRKKEIAERKAKEASEDAGIQAAPKKRHTRSIRRRRAISSISRRGRVIHKGDAKNVKTGEEGKTGQTELAEVKTKIAPEKIKEIEENKIMVNKGRLEAKAMALTLEADKKEIIAKLEANRKKMEAELAKMSSDMNIEKISRQINIDVSLAKANALELKYNAGTESLRVQASAVHSKKLAKVMALRAKTVFVKNTNAAEVSRLLTSASTIEVNTPVEVESRCTAIAMLEKQGIAESKKFLAEARVSDENMEAALSRKNTIVAVKEIERDTMIATLGSEIDTQIKMALAKGGLLQAGIELAQAKVVFKNKNIKASLAYLQEQKQAEIDRKKALMAIEHENYASEIKTLAAAAQTDKKIRESEIALKEANIYAQRQTSLAQASALTALAISEEKKIIASLESSKIEKEAYKERLQAEKMLLKAKALAKAEKAIANAEKQDIVAQKAHDKARADIKEINRVVKVKREFEEKNQGLEVASSPPEEILPLKHIASPVPFFSEFVFDQ
ncbi:MAG: hypothetical protein KAV18_05865, partial [Candidatus Omnitrophica bacterium]|nr:hypothetical protein [Candidatus Omnitrophota bacterium]